MNAEILKLIKAIVDNEEVFRNVIRDMKNRDVVVPKNLNPESKLEEIMDEYCSTNIMRGKFTINSFNVYKNEVTISFADLLPLSGRGATLVYKLNQDKSVEYKGNPISFMS
jgi:hypothetical protein